MAVCATAQANEKKYIKIGSKQFLRCQPVPGYSGSAALGGTTGSANEWWMIQMEPSAQWNSPRCVARGTELLFKNNHPIKNIICNNNVVEFEKIQRSTNGSCKDIPWPATGIWEKFPEGALGSETQLRADGYKYKLVTRKGGMIYATHCFKDRRLLSLSELGQRWNVSLVPFKTYGNMGDGGKHTTLVIGIAQ